MTEKLNKLGRIPGGRGKYLLNAQNTQKKMLSPTKYAGLKSRIFSVWKMKTVAGTAHGLPL
jgi:hypothetical protein